MAEIIVSDFLGLRNALTDATSTIIKLDNDITFTSSGGALIPRTKGDIIIDGQGHTITDYNSAGGSDALRIGTAAGPDLKVTIQNVTWIGRNYYGVLYVPDDTDTANFILELKNMNYDGVQAVYHRRGLTRVIDSSFTLQQQGTASSLNEFGELHELYIEGDVSITSYVPNGSIYSMFWFVHAGSSLTVADNAKFEVTSVNNYVFYSDCEPPMEFGENSTTIINSARGLWLYASTSNHMASSFLLKQGASFSAYTGRTSASIPIFKCRNNFVLEQDSMFYLETRTSGTGGSLYFPAVANNIKFNDPKSVVVYNNGGNVFSLTGGTSSNPNIISINANLLNYWSAATAFPSAGTFDDTPTRAFSKADETDIYVTINSSASTIYTISSNIVSDDSGYPLNATTFPILSAKVLSMGNIDIDLNDVSDISTHITGATEKLALLRASYLSSQLNDTSGADGAIMMPIPSPIPVDTIVDFGVNWRFLIRWIQFKVLGSVSITYLPDLAFKTFLVPHRSDIVKRKNPDWYMQVTDTRTEIDSPDWYLYVALPSPLSTGASTLDDVLILREQTDKTLSPDYILVRSQSYTPPAPIVTTLTWQELEGFLLSVDPNFLYDAGNYASSMSWFVQTTPLDDD